MPKLQRDGRLSRSLRGYDRAWYKLRARFLADHPTCIECAKIGRVEVATVVDHIEAIEPRPDLRLEWSNLRPMCKPCHDAHTIRTQGVHRHHAKHERLSVGQDGMPIDPRHPWRRGA